MKYAVPLLIASAGFVFAAPSEDPQEIIKRARSAYEQLKTCQIVANSTNVMTADESETTVKSKRAFPSRRRANCVSRTEASEGC